MVMLLLFLGIGTADLLFSRRYAMPTSTALSTEEREKMTMGMTPSFLGLEGQTSSSLEDMP